MRLHIINRINHTNKLKGNKMTELYSGIVRKDKNDDNSKYLSR